MIWGYHYFWKHPGANAQFHPSVLFSFRETLLIRPCIRVCSPNLAHLVNPWKKFGVNFWHCGYTPELPCYFKPIENPCSGVNSWVEMDYSPEIKMQHAKRPPKQEEMKKRFQSFKPTCSMLIFQDVKNNVMVGCFAPFCYFSLNFCPLTQGTKTAFRPSFFFPMGFNHVSEATALVTTLVRMEHFHYFFEWCCWESLPRHWNDMTWYETIWNIMKWHDIKWFKVIWDDIKHLKWHDMKWYFRDTKHYYDMTWSFHRTIWNDLLSRDRRDWNPLPSHPGISDPKLNP